VSFHDDRICKKIDRTDKVNLVCKNHPEKVWYTKNIEYIGARSIFWGGEYVWQPPLKEPIWKPGYEMVGSPLKYVTHLLNGKNPFNTQIAVTEPYTWDDLVRFVEAVKVLEQKYSFECDCSGRDLIISPEYADMPDLVVE